MRNKVHWESPLISGIYLRLRFFRLETHMNPIRLLGRQIEFRRLFNCLKTYSRFLISEIKNLLVLGIFCDRNLLSTLLLNNEVCL